VIAGTHSGVGKTTVATGLMAAFAQRGVAVASAKVGPDFIDPGYHQIATGRVGRNLDSFLCDRADIGAIAATATIGATLLVIEGVMGLFDGVGSTPSASTAEIAALLEAPVVLVVDASSMSSSVRALVDGFARHLEENFGNQLAGVILNRVGSDNHEALLREALAEGLTRVLGAIGRDPALAWRERHLGLVPVVEHTADVRASVDRLGSIVASAVDLARIEQLARGAPQRSFTPPRSAQPAGRNVRIALMTGPAFSFCYPENLERLREAGAELVPLDPLADSRLPDEVGGLYACGGFPEVFAAALSDNEPLVRNVRQRIEGGMPCWAECGGLLWLARSLDGHRMCGVIPTDATLGTRVAVGYRTATVRRDSPVAANGTVLRGHEHHYSRCDPEGDALELVGRAGVRLDGWSSPRLFATYLHLHLGSDPTPAERFVRSALATPPRPGGTSGPRPATEPQRPVAS
jgi:cobyrinic acid a,c-diamide synthase